MTRPWHALDNLAVTLGVLLFATVVFAASGCSKCTRQGRAVTPQEFIKLLDAAPAWGLMSSDDLGIKGPQLDKVGAEFQRLSPKTARDIVMRYSDICGKRTGNGEPTTSLSKLYVLLRFYFAVPRTAPSAGASYFGGWIGVPQSGGYTSPLWPLEESANGTVYIAGTLKGYNGAIYDAAGEFDSFAKKYGPRSAGRCR